jgi:hypothetical protein
VSARTSIGSLSVVMAVVVAAGMGAGLVRAGGVMPAATQRVLRSSDGGQGDSVGYAVALRGDTALVGAPRHWVGGSELQGAAYVFDHASGGWSQAAELIASDGAASDMFGSAVALSSSIAAVGAPDAQGGRGAVYLFAPSGTGGWAQVAELTATDGAPRDGFGFTLGLSGSTLLVGAPGHTLAGKTSAGAVYVFDENRGDWSHVAELTAPDAGAFDEFGWALAVSQSSAVVGAPGHSIGTNLGQGEAYAFARDHGRWSQTVTLVASDGAAYDAFAESVAMSGNTAVLGAPARADYRGAGYVFVRSDHGWSQTTTLTAHDGRSFDEFGGRVAIESGEVLVGAHSHSPPGTTSAAGAAYLFSQQTSGSWTESAELIDAHAQPDELFGEAVALCGSNALVGAVSHGAAGAAFVISPV